MSDPNVQRLSSAHLEDLAYIILSARPSGDGFDFYSDIDENMRARLRSRVKQLSRYDWPSTVLDDPAFRRGYTLAQCCRLMVALLLLDAYLPPSFVVSMAYNNELHFLRAIAARLDDPSRPEASPHDLIALINPAEIQDTLGFPGRNELRAERVEFVARADLKDIWSDGNRAPGAHLAVDIPTAAAAMWRWISGRRLLADTAREDLLSAVGSRQAEPGYQRTINRCLRR